MFCLTGFRFLFKEISDSCGENPDHHSASFTTRSRAWVCTCQSRLYHKLGKSKTVILFTSGGQANSHYEGEGSRVKGLASSVDCRHIPVHSVLLHFILSELLVLSKASLRHETGAELPPCHLLAPSPNHHLSSHLWRNCFATMMKI